MIKTLQNVLRQDSNRNIPRSVQQSIPIDAIHKDGIFCVSKGLYSKTFRFTDINYATASREDKEAMFLDYSELINSFEVGATTKISIIMRKINTADYARDILMPLQNDERDIYREELNEMLMEKATAKNSMLAEKYITVTVPKKNIEEARTAFTRIGSELSAHLTRLGSKYSELNAAEKLRVLHDFYRVGDEQGFCFDMPEQMKRGHSFKDSICPDSMEFQSGHFRLGNRYGRVLFIKEWASYIKDSMISELAGISRNLVLSIDVVPVPTDEAVREVEKRLLGTETNITNWQRKQNQNNNFSAVVPYDMELQRKESKEFLDDLSTRNQRMMFAVVTLVHTADTLEQLDNDTETLMTIARKNLCQLGVLRYQQLDGLNTALPIGVRRIDTFRTLTTESLAVLMPFRVQEIMDSGGIYYGDNAVTHNPIFCNKGNLLNPNTFVLGIPGSGKSMITKIMLAFIILSTNDHVLVLDPESEYGALIEALGGVRVRIAAGSDDHINALDMVEGYGDNSDPIVNKSEYVLSIFDLIERTRQISSREQSIIDRCLSAVYEECTDRMPTFIELREKLLQQPEEEAKGLALSLELFTSGSLNTFAHPTNVDTDNRVICYDIRDLGDQLRSVGSLVITDAMRNRVALNWKKGIRTHIITDEFHVLFANKHSASFFNSAWRMFRKRGGYPCAITQNVEYLLDSVDARTMLSNSEMLVLLNQASSDRMALSKLLNISEEQMSYVDNADAGCGLIKYGSAIVPFVNRFPKDTKLYRLMTTKPSEKADD